VGRIVVFNQHTKENLPQDLGAVAEFSFGLSSQDTLEYLSPVFETDREALLVIPSSIEGCVCAVHLRPVPKPELLLEESALPLEPEYEATGFLGLSDAVYAIEPRPRRRWWHWLWS
jgi:hypothetical protein